jgi:hypothetical protein
MTVVYRPQSLFVAGPATPCAALVGEMPYSVPHGADGALPFVTTVLYRPAGFLGFSSQYCAGVEAAEPKNIAA